MLQSIQLIKISCRHIELPRRIVPHCAPQWGTMCPMLKWPAEVACLFPMLKFSILIYSSRGLRACYNSNELSMCIAAYSSRNVQHLHRINAEIAICVNMHLQNLSFTRLVLTVASRRISDGIRKILWCHAFSSRALRKRCSTAATWTGQAW